MASSKLNGPSSSNGDPPSFDPSQLPTWKEERESSVISEDPHEALTFQSSSGEGDADFENGRRNGRRSPYTPTTPPLPGKTSFASVAKSLSSSASIAEFYAARDAARGHALFGGGGLERDMVHKMVKNTSQQSTSSSSAGADISFRSEPGTPKRSRAKWDASLQISESHGSSGLTYSPSSVQGELLPATPLLPSYHPGEAASGKRMSYDPYRPRDGIAEDGERKVPTEISMSRWNVNRISRALQDIEIELTRTHHRIAKPSDAPEEEEDLDTAYDYSYNYEQPSAYAGRREAQRPYDMDEHESEHDALFEVDHGTSRSRSASDASFQKAFVYDDTEEIDPALSRLPSQQKSPHLRNARASPQASPPEKPRADLTEEDDHDEDVGPLPSQSFIEASAAWIHPRERDEASTGATTDLPSSPSRRHASPVLISPIRSISSLHHKQNSSFSGQSNSLPNGSKLVNKSPSSINGESARFISSPQAAQVNNDITQPNGPPLSPPPNYGLPPLPPSSSPLRLALRKSARHDGRKAQSRAEMSAPDFEGYEFPSSFTENRSRTNLYEGNEPSPRGSTFSGEMRNHLPNSPECRQRPISATSFGSSFNGNLLSPAHSESELTGTLARVSKITEEEDGAINQLKVQGVDSYPINGGAASQIRHDQVENFLQNSVGGLRLEDLQELQQRLVSSAMAGGHAIESTENENDRRKASPIEQRRALMKETVPVSSRSSPSNPKRGTSSRENPVSASPLNHSEKTPDVSNATPAKGSGQSPGVVQLGSPLLVQGEVGNLMQETPSEPSMSSSSLLSRKNAVQRPPLISYIGTTTSSRQASAADGKAMPGGSPRATDGNERNSPVHPTSSPLHDLPLSSKSFRRPPTSTSSRFEEDLPGEYFQSRSSSTGESKDSNSPITLPTPPATPQRASPRPSTLRPAQTRVSNSTPSMLIRHVQQQTSEATAALKSPSISPSNPLNTSDSPRRALSHRKSAKNLKISTPQLVSSSTNLDSMPSVENLKSPKQEASGSGLTKKSSSAGLKFRTRLNKMTGSKDSHGAGNGLGESTSVVPGVVSLRSATPFETENGSLSSTVGGRSPNAPDAQGGVKGLIFKLRKRRNALAGGAHSLTDSAVLDTEVNRAEPGNPCLPQLWEDTSITSIDLASSPPPANTSLLSRSPVTYAVGRRRAPDMHSVIMSESASQVSSPSTPQMDRDRSSAASSDSMRKLFEAATALDLDPKRVSELVDAAGYNSKQETLPSTDVNTLIRRTVILPSSSKSMPMSGTASLTRSRSESSPRAGLNGSQYIGGASSRSLQRSESVQTGKESYTGTDTSGSLANSSSRHPRVSSDANMSGTSDTHSTGRSVHDRVPTPPPTKQKQKHFRQQSEAEDRDRPLPRVGPLNSPQLASHSMVPAKSSNNGIHMRDMLPYSHSRMSVMSGRSAGSYDAKSIYGLYGDDDPDEIPPPPGLKDIDLVLASGRIPGPSADTRRASLAFAPGVDMRRLSTASNVSRVELAEYANGDIAFNIVQSLRAGSIAGDRTSFFPINLHRKQASEASLEEKIAGSGYGVPGRAKPLDSDPLRLMVRRHQKSRKDAEALEMSMLQKNTKNERLSSDSFSSSRHSVVCLTRFNA